MSPAKALRLVAAVRRANALIDEAIAEAEAWRSRALLLYELVPDRALADDVLDLQTVIEGLPEAER